MLPCVAESYNVLQFVAVCCSVKEERARTNRQDLCARLPCVAACVAVCCSLLQFVVVYCSMLQYVAVCYSILRRVAMCYSVLQCVAVKSTHMQVG